MIAIVSSAARDSRARLRPRSRRPTHSACSGEVTSRCPPAISRSWTPASRLWYSASRLCRASATSVAGTSSDSASRASVSGSSEEKSRASSADLRFDGGMGLTPFTCAMQDRDVAEVLGLYDADLAELDQLEQGHEGDHHLEARAAFLEHRHEGDRALLRGRAREQRHLVLAVEGLCLDLVDAGFGQARHHAMKGVEQVEQAHRRERQRPGVFLARQHAALVEEPPLVFLRPQCARGLLELAVLDQALHQPFPRIALV